MKASRAPAPLWPAGHLPHKWGDRLEANSLSFISRLAPCAVAVGIVPARLAISPPVGEMPGRAEEGGFLPRQRFNSKETHNVPHP
ncbi:hypothetical protein B5K11_20725 [Rhizobium leguminosarum bv. trifolii]|nr:hypothetical protein B5K11_20725 [Rhizobium leguminosarum bv. trifolii]